MARVVVIGSSNTDMTFRLPRLPAPGQTVLGGSLVTGPGGKGANQAVAAARAGAEVVFVTAVGEDELGRRALESYRREGIDVRHARTCPGVPSGVALIFVDDAGENMIGVAPGANAMLSAEDIDRLPDDLFGAASPLLIAGLEVPVEAVHRAIARAHRHKTRVILNPAPVDLALLKADGLNGVRVITPNRIELAQVTGMDVSDVAGLVVAATALRDLGAGLDVVVTLGADGCLVLAEGGHRLIPAHKVRPVDTVGAGDAFNGALAVALADGKSLTDAASWASAAAALAVTLPGAQGALACRDEINRLVSTRLV